MIFHWFLILSTWESSGNDVYLQYINITIATTVNIRHDKHTKVIILSVMSSFKGALHNNSYTTVILAGVIRGITTGGDSGNYQGQNYDCSASSVWYMLFITFSFPLVAVFIVIFHCLFMLSSQLSPGGKSLFQSSITEPEKWCCVTSASVSSWPNECHLHMLVETSAISADSHVCSGLLSWVEKQLGVNKRKESAYTWAWPLCKWHQIALFIFFSLPLSLLVLQ